MLNRIKRVDGNLEDEKITVAKEVTSKVFNFIHDGPKDTAYWRQPSLQTLVLKTSNVQLQYEFRKKKLLHFFMNEAYRRTYLEFRLFCVKDDIGATIKSISRINTIKTMMAAKMK